MPSPSHPLSFPSPSAFKLPRISSVQFICHQGSPIPLLSCVQLFATPWTAAHQTSLSITNSQSLLKLRSIESVMPSKHLILCRPLLLLQLVSPVQRNESATHVHISSAIPFSSHLQSFPASGSFPRVSSLYQVAKVLEFQLQHQSYQ